MSLRRLLPALAAAYAALAVLVATGALNRLDQWSIDRVMPGLGRPGEPPTLAEAAVPLLGAHWDDWLDVVTNVVTLPAQGFVSLALLLALRELRWLAAWLAGNVVELLCKSVIVRPPLFHDGAHLLAFDSSYPSGHTLRSVILAVALAALWPRARWLAAAWAAASLTFLVVAGHHVPSDVGGGVLLGLLACGGAAGALGRRRLARRAAA